MREYLKRKFGHLWLPPRTKFSVERGGGGQSRLTRASDFEEVFQTEEKIKGEKYISQYLNVKIFFLHIFQN